VDAEPELTILLAIHVNMVTPLCICGCHWHCQLLPSKAGALRRCCRVRGKAWKETFGRQCSGEKAGETCSDKKVEAC